VSLCASCGLTLPEGIALCPHHASDLFDEWATWNRAMCDFVHRRRALPRLAAAEREPIYEHPEAA